MNTNYEAKKRAWTKYNRSLKKRLASRRYREKNKEKCSAWSLAWQRRNREHIREMEKRRNATPYGKMIRKAIQARYNAKNYIKRLAKDSVHNAIRAKKLNKSPCETCGMNAEAHHPDYTKPLKVIWLCQKHHKALHYKKKKD